MPSRLSRSIRALPVAVLLLAPLGCATTELEPRRFRSRALPGVSAQEAFQQAEDIMRREFGGTSPDRADMALESGPEEFVASSDTGTARDLVGASSTMRRRGTLRIRQRGDATVAEIRIDIERRDSERRRAAASSSHQDSRIDDLPGRTPIERDAATTNEQNTVWTQVRRDEALERALLDELYDWALALSRPEEGAQAPEAEPAPAAPQPPPAEPRP
jgi:hypothetical protein